MDVMSTRRQVSNNIFYLSGHTFQLLLISTTVNMVTEEEEVLLMS